MTIQEIIDFLSATPEECRGYETVIRGAEDYIPADGETVAPTQYTAKDDLMIGCFIDHEQGVLALLNPQSLVVIQNAMTRGQIAEREANGFFEVTETANAEEGGSEAMEITEE